MLRMEYVLLVLHLSKIYLYLHKNVEDKSAIKIRWSASQKKFAPCPYGVFGAARLGARLILGVSSLGRESNKVKHDNVTKVTKVYLRESCMNSRQIKANAR